MISDDEPVSKNIAEALADPTGRKAAMELAMLLEERRKTHGVNMNDTLFYEISAELMRAEKHPKFASLHEAYAVILEEVDELWEHVRQKRRLRVPNEVRAELVQIAAMSIKAIHSMENFWGAET